MRARDVARTSLEVTAPFRVPAGDPTGDTVPVMWGGRRAACGVAILGLLACGDDSPPAATTSSGTSEAAGEATGPTSSGPATTTTTTTTTTTATTAPASMTTGEVTTDAATSDDPASSGDAASSSGTTGAAAPCDPGQVACDGPVALVCDDDGTLAKSERCDGPCVPGLGCVACVPGSAACDGEVSRVCGADGLTHVETHCDPVQGLACDLETGRCVGACAPDELGASYIGCDYYPTVTPNVVDPLFSFAVAVSNTTGAPAKVKITRGAALVQDLTVEPGSVDVVTLPWIAALKAPKGSALIQDGAYRLRSDRPVTVYQYNPLEYTKFEMYSHSNDASLLLPTNVWGKHTRVVARNTFQTQPGAYVVVARREGTIVELTPSATGAPVVPGGGVGPDGHGQALLGAGDALVVISGVGGGVPDVVDLTGTLVAANHPVQVIGAHACTNVPHDKPACDHLEESNLPLDNLSQTYFLTAPLVKPPKLPPIRKARLVRVVATEDATALTYDPPQPGAPAMLLKAGDHAEFVSQQDFALAASARVAVAEYMLGQSAGGDSGDPAMTIAVPPALFRAGYAVHAPIHYESNFVNLIAPAGAAVSLDNKPVPPNLWSPIGQSGWSAARVALVGKADGDHQLSADQPFGVQVYGYGQYTSYWYPGGLNLQPL